MRVEMQVQEHPCQEEDADVIEMAAQIVRNAQTPIDARTYVYRHKNERVSVKNRGATGFYIEVWRGDYVFEIEVVGTSYSVEFDNLSMNVRYSTNVKTHHLRNEIRTRLNEVLRLEGAFNAG